MEVEKARNGAESRFARRFGNRIAVIPVGIRATETARINADIFSAFIQVTSSVLKRTPSEQEIFGIDSLDPARKETAEIHG